MEAAFDSIETLLRESETLIKLAAERSESDVIDSRGQRANFSSLCDRVNRIGNTLSQIQTEIQEFTREKAELMGIVEKIENLEPNEVEKLANILK